MRKQIAAANWKMNLTYAEGEKLLKDIMNADISLHTGQEVVFAVPFPYLQLTQKLIGQKKGYHAAAQNCHHKESGAYTGEVSAGMLNSVGINYCVIGHSERREYNAESNKMLSEKLNLCFSHEIIPIFCCGESLPVRESGNQNQFVEKQLGDSLFHLDKYQLSKLVIAYEPIWAIGTGKTASTEEAQEMHKHLRSVIGAQFGEEISSLVPILYGGSVKASNAGELFNCPDVDGGLVGGASLVAKEFVEIVRALKH